MYRGEPRLGCYSRQRGLGCTQRSASLSVYEDQILAYLSTFQVPEDYRKGIVEAHRKLEAAYSDSEEQRSQLELQLKRARELFEWGDYTRAECRSRRDDIVRQLDLLIPNPAGPEHLEGLARFLADVPSAWSAARQEQRNRLARCLFDQVWVEDKAVVAVKPRPELEPFFRLNYEDFVSENIEGERSRKVELYREHGDRVLLMAA